MAAALKPYQSALLENRDLILRDVRTNEVCPLLYVSGVLTQKEIDGINIGRTPQERTESLLDLLHYKGPTGFQELCVALEDSHPHLAAKLRAKNPQIEVLEGKPRDAYPRYSNPQRVRDFEQRENNNNEFYHGKREYYTPERNFSQEEQPRKEMRGEEQLQRGRDYSYDRGREVSQYITEKYNEGRNYVENDAGSERNYRKSVGDASPSEQYVWERQTIVLEKANSNQGFGIAVSGGKDNPHFKSGDTSIVVSDIVPDSPADGLLKVNDIITQVNDINVENVLHSTAVQALKDSGNSARLAIKRQKLAPVMTTPREGSKVPQTVTLVREQQNKGYGFSLGGSMFIKEIDKNGMVARQGELKSGDIILKINDRKSEEMSLREAIDMVRRSNKLDLVVLKDDQLPPSYSTHSLPAAFRHKTRDRDHDLPNGYNEEPELPPRHYSEDDLPERPPPPLDKDNLLFSGSSWKRPDTGERVSGIGYDKEEVFRAVESSQQESEPHFPKPAEVSYTPDGLSSWGRNESVNASRSSVNYVESTSSSPRSDRKDGAQDSVDRRRYRGDARLVAFRKSGSLGIQVSGGNKTGIFVAAVKEGSPAYNEGLRKGDQVLMANDIDFKDITREEAVLILLSLGDEVNLLCKYRRQTFDKISKESGDSFYIKVHFDYEQMKEQEFSFQREDVFHIWDTMHDGVIGAWRAQVVTKTGLETEIGILPNKSRAEQLAQVQQKVEQMTPRKGDNYGSLKRSNSRGGTLKKYKFVSSDHLDEESFTTTALENKLPAYERVALRKPGFVRPVVLLGPIADITRDKLLQDMPDVFAIPTAFRGLQPAGRSPMRSSRRSLSYVTIKAVIDSGKHCLLDITPEEVERLNFAQLYPIVIFLRPPNKQMVKEMRSQHGVGDQSAKMIKKLHDNSLKLEQFYSNMFTAVIPAGSMDNWYSRVKEEITKQQEDPVWMSEDKFDEQEEIEFRMPSRFSQSYDYDSTLDSPTVRSSVSTQPVDEDIMHAEPSMEVNSEPPRVRPAYSDPHLRYEDPDYQEDFHPRQRYVEDDFRNGTHGFNEDTLERQRPGYKRPSGNVVKLLPSRENPVELRQSLKKTRMPDGFDRSEADAEELRMKRESLRKVEGDSDLLKEYDARVGVPVSKLWAIDNESSQRREQIDRIREPPIEVQEKKKEVEADLEKRLEDLESALIPQRRRSVEERKPRPFSESYDRKPRNLVVDYSNPDKKETAHSSYYPTRSYPTVTRFDRDKPAESEIRANVSDYRVESAPQTEFPMNSENRTGSLSREPRYRAEVTIPTRTAPKFDAGRPERPRSAYSAYAPKPFNAGNNDRPSSGDRPFSRDPPTSRPSDGPRIGDPVTYNFRLSGSPRFSRPEREPDPRPTTYRTEYRHKVTSDLDNMDHEGQNVVTSDFESLDEDTQVVATARGKFTSQGGVLSSPESGVSIVIPEGAIPPGVEQEIYFKVCKDNNFMPPLDSDRGETLLSPLVMCGPHGTQFLKPVELRLPHCASMTPDGWSFALKSSDTPTGQPSEWKNVSLQGRDSRGDQCQVDSNSVSVLVDHFSAFSLVGRSRPHTRGKATKRMLAAVFAPPPRVNDDWALNVVLLDDTEAAFKDVCNSEGELGRFPFSPFKPVLVHGDASDVRVQLRDLNNNWVARSSCKKYIEFHDSWEAYRHAPCVEFLIRDRNFSPSSNVCVVDVFQEGHEGETAAVSVSTRPRKIGGQKVQYLI